MTTFDEREKGFEAKYKRDQDLQFKVMARRNKLLGLWAAELMNITGADAEAYAKQVIASDFEKPGDEDVFEKVWADVQSKGLDLSEDQVRGQMLALMHVAREQVTSE